MRAMILAAGRGERLRPLTDAIPKALVAVHGRPLIEWQVRRLVQGGYRELVINHAWLGDQIEAQLGSGQRFGAAIEYSREGEALETLGGIVAALPLLGSKPFLVVSADIYTDFDYATLISVGSALEGRAAAARAYFVLVENPPWHPQGDMGLNASDEVTLDAPRLTYANIGLFHPELFAEVPRATKLKLFPWGFDLVRAGRVRGGRFRGGWHNIGTADDLALANASTLRPA